MIALAIAVLLAAWSMEIAIYIIAILTVLVNVTALQRVWIAIKKSEEL